MYKATVLPKLASLIPGIKETNFAALFRHPCFLRLFIVHQNRNFCSFFVRHVALRDFITRTVLYTPGTFDFRLVVQSTVQFLVFIKRHIRYAGAFFQRILPINTISLPGQQSFNFR
jgi:hypothetical protein